MTPSSRSRDGFRLGISSVTAVVTAASLTAVGWFAGAAARQQETKQAADAAARTVSEARAARARATYEAAVAAAKSAAIPRKVLLRPRPQRTVVHTEYTRAAQAPVTLGGSTYASQTPSTPSAPAPHAPVVHSAPPPPPPPPPPAPSSGS